MTASALQIKFQTLEDSLKGEIVEHDREIHGAVLGLATRSHVFFLGVPGIAKSFLFNRLLMRISDAQKFKLLMGNYTVPEAVFGPLDIVGLENGFYRRKLDGYLATAHVAFLDEAWKANDSILDELLEIFNERTYKNDGVTFKAPLSTAFLASNELPSNDTLNAIYDRVMLRYEMHNIIESGNFEQMLKLSAPDEVEVLLTWEEVEEAQREVTAMPIDDAVFSTLAEIRRDLKDRNILPSDRRFKQSLAIMQGEAWLEGFDRVEADQIMILSHVFWDDPSQIVEIDRILSEKANPREKELLDLLNDIDQIGALVKKAIDTEDEEGRVSIGLEAAPKVRSATALIATAKDDPSLTRRVRELVETCDDRLRNHSAILLRDVFHHTDDQVKSVLTPKKKSK